MDHAHSTPGASTFVDSDNDSVGSLTRVSRTTRERGEVLCDSCGRTASRAVMMVDPDVESESGWICAEGHGCAAPRTERVTVAGRRLPADALHLPDAAVAVRAQVEADLIAAGGPVILARLGRRERAAVLAELRSRFERASTRLVDAVAGQNGPAIRTRLEDAQRAAACVARYLEAAKGRPRRSS
jgi:hypothetical protein